MKIRAYWVSYFWSSLKCKNKIQVFLLICFLGETSFFRLHNPLRIVVHNLLFLVMCSDWKAEILSCYTKQRFTTQTIIQNCRIVFIRVESVSWEWVSVFNLYYYRIQKLCNNCYWMPVHWQKLTQCVSHWRINKPYQVTVVFNFRSINPTVCYYLKTITREY